MEVLNEVVRIYIGFGRNDGLVSEKKVILYEVCEMNGELVKWCSEYELMAEEEKLYMNRFFTQVFTLFVTPVANISSVVLLIRRRVW